MICLLFFDKNLTKLNAFKDPFIESISFHTDCLVLKVFATLFLLHEKCWDFDEHIKNVKVKDVNNQSWACNNFISWYKRQRIKPKYEKHFPLGFQMELLYIIFYIYYK